MKCIPTYFRCYAQIQNWPTPVMYVQLSSEPPEVGGRNTGNVSMLSVIVVAPIIQSVLDDDSRAAVSLLSIVVIAPITRTISDDSNAAVSMQSVVVIAPITQTNNEVATGNVSLLTVVQDTPVTQTITVENQPAAVSMLSVVVV